MIKVLQVYPQMNNAGTERVILNLYENINRNEIQFDFLVEKPGEIDEYLRSLGAKIYYIFHTKEKDYYKSLLKFFEQHGEYNIVHAHTHARMNLVLKAARKMNVSCRIAHSHNARNDLNRLMWFIKGLTNIPMECNATHFFACSTNAARWLFPHKLNCCQILPNGINLEKYLFDLNKRNDLRRKFQIKENEVVFIHVGRFAKQKNHEYLVKILDEYNRLIRNEWKALFVGTGPLEKDIKEMCVAKHINQYVLFLGNRNDVAELLNCADCFLFPSLHEGLGIVVIEAQANALPCIVSRAVPEEANLKLGLMKRLNLTDSIDKWVNEIAKINMNVEDRVNQIEQIINCEYNIKKVSNYMTEFYKEAYKNG